jgi:hypothetical protein
MGRRMLGYVTAGDKGGTDRLLRDCAAALQADGYRVAGAVQTTAHAGDGGRAAMDLHILSGPRVVRISQNLGAAALGCRLDPGGLEQAVAMVAEALTTPVDIVIVNKFGKHEVETGRGFRPVIAEALTRGVPVLVAVPAAHEAAFATFADGMAQPLAADAAEMADWCRATIAAARG